MWYQKHDKRASGVVATALKVVGKGADAFRMPAWARRHDVIIVPGMGVLEASLPLKAWGLPYELFLICAAGRLFGTKVALVSVGADLSATGLCDGFLRRRRDSPSTVRTAMFIRVTQCASAART